MIRPGPQEREFKNKVDLKMKANMTRAAAVSAVVKEDPALHVAYLAEYSDARGLKNVALKLRMQLADLPA